ncbi:hypothetical protein [Bdellovibrio svalbardensis]|uniref:Uncharacterized protein n=1 Tax=Bdellovibrio svalbardensis TaxID=2972972 RepID=A0ABT6DKT0_9BACT|nr:hypothetical protein [Bdellovibrio svalbardensis]MDG0817481.1 hypothetical protein [Bdellovibrio svalbardensis]
MRALWNVLVFGLAIGLVSCKPNSSDVETPRYLFVSSGTCYVGNGLTAETPSRTVSKVKLDTGVVDSVVLDYNSVNAADRPQALVDYDSENILVLVENSSTNLRRIDLVKKAGGNSFSTYYSDSASLTNTAAHVVRSMMSTPDGGLLISKSVAAEKISSSKGRVTVGANPFINSPTGGANCGTTNNTLITSAVALPNGKYIIAHAAATPNNRVLFINNTTGYNSSADCTAPPAAPATTTFPTAMVYIPTAAGATTGYLLVAWSSSTANQDYIYAYNVNESTGAITGATKAYENTSVLRGISAMTYDSSTGSVYVANGSTALANAIEKFSFDSTSKTLTRSMTTPFSGTTFNTKCITSMLVAEESSQ